MTAFCKMSATALFLCLPLCLVAQYQTIELGDVQSAKSLSAVVQYPNGDPIPNALLEEVSPDWKTVLRTSTTDTDGKFSLVTVKGRKIYFLQISAYGFDTLRVRVRVDPKRGTDLKLKLEIAT